MFPFSILLELRTVEVVITTGALRFPKLQSNRLNQQTDIQLSTDRIPFLSANQQCQITEVKNITFHAQTYSPQAHLGIFQVCL